jgi:hypothetical protein
MVTTLMRKANKNRHVLTDQIDDAKKESPGGNPEKARKHEVGSLGNVCMSEFD